jgi:hypothetical protein
VRFVPLSFAHLKDRVVSPVGEGFAAGNDLTYAHYDDLPHGFIQMTRHSKRCLESTLEIARLLGEALKKTRAAAAKR